MDGVLHGFRSSFRVWAEERTRAGYLAIELSLAHKVGSDVERAYRRTDLLDQRRELMQAWADYATPTSDRTPCEARPTGHLWGSEVPPVADNLGRMR